MIDQVFAQCTHTLITQQAAVFPSPTSLPSSSRLDVRRCLGLVAPPRLRVEAIGTCSARSVVALGADQAPHVPYRRCLQPLPELGIVARCVLGPVLALLRHVLASHRGGSVVLAEVHIGIGGSHTHAVGHPAQGPGHDYYNGSDLREGNDATIQMEDGLAAKRSTSQCMAYTASPASMHIINDINQYHPQAQSITQNASRPTQSRPVAHRPHDAAPLVDARANRPEPRRIDFARCLHNKSAYHSMQSATDTQSLAIQTRNFNASRGQSPRHHARSHCRTAEAAL